VLLAYFVAYLNLFRWLGGVVGYALFYFGVVGKFVDGWMSLCIAFVWVGFGLVWWMWWVGCLVCLVVPHWVVVVCLCGCAFVWFGLVVLWLNFGLVWFGGGWGWFGLVAGVV